MKIHLKVCVRWGMGCRIMLGRKGIASTATFFALDQKWFLAERICTWWGKKWLLAIINNPIFVNFLQVRTWYMVWERNSTNSSRILSKMLHTLMMRFFCTPLHFESRLHVFFHLFSIALGKRQENRDWSFLILWFLAFGVSFVSCEGIDEPIVSKGACCCADTLS